MAISKKVKVSFANAETLAELKEVYLEASKKYVGTKSIAEINNLYGKYFDEVKTWNKTKDGKKYEKPCSEEGEDFIEQIAVLKTIEGINLEMIGTWLWVTGETKAVRDTLKSVGCRYAPNKQAWYIAPADAKRSKKHYSLNELRTMHGSEEVEGV